MSKQLTEEEAQALIGALPNSRSIYNWDEWLDGNWHQIIRGVDYHCNDSSFRNLVYLRGRERSDVVVVRKIEDGFLVKKQGDM
jgi:hypothetical protein